MESSQQKQPEQTPETEQEVPQEQADQSHVERLGLGGNEPSQADALQAEIASLKEQLLRALAETENTRRRSRIDVEEAGKYAVTNFARDLINVLENLHRAEEALPQEQLAENPALKAFYEGVEMTKRELLTIFDRQGIRRISPEGEMYDHNFHQAMVQIPDAEKAPGTVVQVMQAGYVIKDRLLRPALVAVAKAVE